MSDYIDEKAGISVEEQKEILTQINSIAEKNRRSLSQGASLENPVVNAKKNGRFFPIIINAAAAAVLIIGIILLVFFNNKADERNRTGNAVYNLVEQALIDEIRKETAEKIAAKELEIASITSRLNDVDNQLSLLRSSNIELTSEQLITQENLLALQHTYRSELAVLQDERALILENSRSREARIRAQLDERTREFAAAQQTASGELSEAMKEIERLTTERERLAAIEALFLGGIDVYLEQLRLEQNGTGLNNFNNNSAEHSDLLILNVQLENTITEMQKTIDAFNSGSTGLERRLGELEDTITSLRNANTVFEQSTAEKDRTITSLQTENSNLSSQVTDLRAANISQEQRIADLNNQLTAIRQLLQDN
ncbi:MAG: hypothetical protein FWD47_13760 [Treponema sp.]|nr:hypothetical protein [Treponema sp.]